MFKLSLKLNMIELRICQNFFKSRYIILSTFTSLIIITCNVIGTYYSTYLQSKKIVGSRTIIEHITFLVL